MASPLSLAQIDGLNFIARHRWVSDTTSQAAAVPVSVHFPDVATISIGGEAFPLDGVTWPDLEIENVAHRKTFAVVHGPWQTSRFRLYNPLIYFAAFGAPEIFDCLEIAIGSLFAFGGFDGTVRVLCDGQNMGFAERFPPAIRSRVRMSPVACGDTLDYTLARYRLSAVDPAGLFQPILYLDTDVVCDAPLQDLLIRLLKSEAIQFCAEHPLTINEHWYGTTLLTHDNYRPAPDERGFSTGLIGFRDAAQAAESFATIVESCLRMASMTENRDLFDTYDQPFANYIMRKLGGYATDLLTPRCAAPAPPADPEERPGFVHFAGGVGNAGPKLARMRDYVARLRAAGGDGLWNVEKSAEAVVTQTPVLPRQ